MSLKPPKGSGATPTPVKTNVVVKRHPPVIASPELTTFKDISWMTVGEERIEVTLRVNQIGDPYKPMKNGQPNKSKHLWIKCCTADDKAVKLKSFYANTERVYETIRDNEIVHFTMLKATNVYNTQLHGSDLGYELLIDDDSVVTGIRLQESAFIKENFADLNDGATNHIRMGILTPFLGGKADESGKTECMARVYDNNDNRAQLFIPFDNMADARSFKKGSNFVIKGYVRVKKDGVINISAKHLWIKCCTADDKAVKLKSFYANTERVYETIRDNEIVHFTMLKATNVYNTQLHGSDLGYELLIDDDSVVTGIRLQESAFIKENFADLNDGATNRIRMGILTPFLGGKADESGKTECMARVYDNNDNRAQLFIPFDNMTDARSFKKGSNFVIKGYVRVKKDGVINISAKLEDIDRETVRKDDSVPDIANTCSTPKKAKIA